MAISDKQAWRALRRSRRLLPHPLHKMQVRMPVIIGGGTIKSGKSQQQRIYTGFSVAKARESLVKSGLDAAQIEQALNAAIVKRFGGFAGSWNNYISGNGWLYEMLELDEAARQRIIEHCGIAELSELIDKMVENPAAMLLDLGGLAQLAQLSARLEKEKESPNSPIRYMLTEHHGLHPELALAVLKHSQAVPWWVLILLPVFAAFTGWMFWQALVNPQAEFFENAGGVSWLHYTVLPLFTVAFIFVTGLMIKDRPRREREWRAQLEKYCRAVASADSEG